MKQNQDVFNSENERIQFAQRFIKERLDSLEKDVRHCLKEPYAPFPALLYCFSTVDLLGALYAGKATPGNTAEQTKNYMVKFMHYTEEQSKYIMDIFRHKLVHLAQPNPVIRQDGKNITWSYIHEEHRDHLKIIELPEEQTVHVTEKKEVKFKHCFYFSITTFLIDIINSVNNPQGYLSSLKTDVALQNNFDFDKAIIHIFGLQAK